jgi:predicted DNA-binding transcriptional regulator AlpA
MSTENSGVHMKDQLLTGVAHETTGLISSTGQKAASVDQFCAAHSISRATFYNLRKAGKGPSEMKVGNRTLISEEAAEAWRRRMERETAAA